MRYAGFWRQLFAVIIDQLVILLPCAFIPQAYFYASVASGATMELAQYHANVMQLVLTVVLMAAYYIFLNGRYGVTLGRHLLNLKLVRLDQPNRDGIGYGKAVLRAVLFAVAGGFIRASTMASLPLVLGVAIDTAAGATIVWLLIDARRRTLEDMLAGTAIIHDASGKFPDFDPDNLRQAKIRPYMFGALILVNALASFFVGLFRY
jgi:uncharacterized RDD family membrane protein YckC